MPLTRPSSRARVFAVLFFLTLLIIISGVVFVVVVIFTLVVGEGGATRATIALGLEDGGGG